MPSSLHQFLADNGQFARSRPLVVVLGSVPVRFSFRFVPLAGSPAQKDAISLRTVPRPQDKPGPLGPADPEAASERLFPTKSRYHAVLGPFFAATGISLMGRPSAPEFAHHNNKGLRPARAMGRVPSLEHGLRLSKLDQASYQFARMEVWAHRGGSSM